jgi:O-antigen ligase
MYKIKKRNIYSFLIFVTILVTLTKTYVVFAHFLGVSVAIITGLFFLINLFILTNHIFLFKNKKGLFILFQFLIIIPLFVSFINLNFSPSALLLQFFYFSQVGIGAVAVLGYRNTISKAVSVAIIVNFIAALASMFSPESFMAMGEIISARYFYGGRAIGFFLQPNSLGLATAVIYILMVFLCDKNKQLKLLPFVLITSILTGSRSAIIILMVLLLIKFWFMFREKKLSFSRIIKPVFKFSFLIAALVIIFLNTNYSRVLFEDIRYNQLISRIEFFLEFNSDKIQEDGSLADRAEYQRSYLNNLNSFILKGNGIGTQQDARAQNILKGSAHQAFLDILFQGGLFYLLSYLVVLFYILRIFIKNKKYDKYKARFALMVFAFMFIISFVSTGILNMRELYLTLGILIQYQATIYNIE